MNFESLLAKQIEDTRANDLTRVLPESERVSPTRIRIDYRECINFSSNDYLGLSFHPDVKKAAADAIKKWGSGSGASRVMSGNNPLCGVFEQRLSEFKVREAALIFSSGYHANLAVLTSVLSREDTVFIDKLAHASIVDGCRLSGVRLQRFPHNNLEALEEVLKKHPSQGKKVIVTEGLFSMDGDTSPLGDLLELAQRYRALLVLDDAHGFGTLGDKGEGIISQLQPNQRHNILAETGTLSKTLGSMGGFVLGSRLLMQHLINQGRTFLFTTALPPANLAAADKALEILQTEPLHTAELQRKSLLLRALLKESGLRIIDGPGPIIPIIIGENQTALKIAETLLTQGFYVKAIRPPTVPQGSARLRLSVNALHTDEELASLAGAIRQLNPLRT